MLVGHFQIPEDLVKDNKIDEKLFSGLKEYLGIAPNTKLYWWFPCNNYVQARLNALTVSTNSMGEFILFDLPEIDNKTVFAIDSMKWERFVNTSSDNVQEMHELNLSAVTSGLPVYITTFLPEEPIIDYRLPNLKDDEEILKHFQGLVTPVEADLRRVCEIPDNTDLALSLGVYFMKILSYCLECRVYHVEDTKQVPQEFARIMATQISFAITILPILYARIDCTSPEFKTYFNALNVNNLLIALSNWHHAVVDNCLEPQSVLVAFQKVYDALFYSGVKLGRNDLCFCGSGKKYKNCCLKKDCSQFLIV